MNIGCFLATKKYLNLLIIILIFNIKNSLQINHPCKNVTALNDLNCFNDVIIFSHRKFRAGHACTYKNGDTIFEFSVDDSPVSTRLFYGLKKNGRYYFPGEPVYKQFNLQDKNDTSNTGSLGRFESHNLLVHTLDDPEKTKEYLFSISTYDSLIELHDIENDDYQSMYIKKFSDKRIFSLTYSLIEIENTDTFVLAAILSDKYIDNNEWSETNTIKKFQINSFSSSNMILKLAEVTNTNNDDVRAISIFRIDPAQLLVLMYIKKGSLLKLRFYDDDLTYLNKETDICTLLHVKPGHGHFVKALALKGNFAVFAYFTDYHNLDTFKFRIVEYDNNYNFTDKITKDLNQYKFLEGHQYNGLFKLDDERVVYTTVDDPGRYLFFFIFDLYNNYTAMRIRRYKMKYITPDLYFNKEFSVSYYNGYITLTGVLINQNEDYPSSTTSMSAMLIIFGFGNGTDFEIDISPYLMDTGYYDPSNNLFDRLMLNLTIDNNIFVYEKVYKI